MYTAMSIEGSGWPRRAIYIAEVEVTRARRGWYVRAHEFTDSFVKLWIMGCSSRCLWEAVKVLPGIRGIYTRGELLFCILAIGGVILLAHGDVCADL